MISTDQLSRTVDACRRAGLPVIEAKQCTCCLRGRLVVLDGADGLRVLWPYDGCCLVHGLPDRDELRPSVRSREGRSRSQAAHEAGTDSKAGTR